jgi:hypothetical protein
LADLRDNVTPAVALTYQGPKDARKRPRQTHPRRKILSCLGHDCDTLAPALEGRSQDALAFALAVNVRSIEKANAFLKSRMNKAGRIGLISSENRAKSSAAKSEPLLDNIKTRGAVHVVEPELLVRILPFSAETG